MPRDGTKNLKPFQKGQSGNPGGRVALPKELRRAIDANREATKALILTSLEPNLQACIDSVIANIIDDGDAMKLKTLLELAMGKMVEDAPEFPITEEEKMLVMEYRRRKAANE